MDWADVRALAETGLATFGPHSARHDILSRLPDEDVPVEVRASHHELKRRLGAAPEVFAYPNGRAVDFDERAKAAVKACGMKWALTTVEGLNDGMTDPLALRRIPVGADLSLPRFRLLVSGALQAMRR
jgi:peptidoglycan/xylan/chitin deacetylase (PgdA/CDA1 family)